MALKSRLFLGNTDLEACLVDDRAHLAPGACGQAVRLVQTALVYLGQKGIAGHEYISGVYGPSTAFAVLAYKTARQIINSAYQTKPDDIVGKMTIKRLDDELLVVQNVYVPRY